MNFYIGDSMKELDINDRNIEYNDDLYQFVYESRKRLESNIQVLFEIDQFSDVLIPFNKVKELEAACQSILNSNILANYDDHDEAKATIQGLFDLCKDAYNLNIGLISIGD